MKLLASLLDANGEAELQSLLNQYDALVRSSGSDEKSRQAELNALSFAVQDPRTDQDDLVRLRFLQRFHTVIDAHYAEAANKEAQAAKPEPYKVQMTEILKSIGTCFQSLCVKYFSGGQSSVQGSFAFVLNSRNHK